MLPCSTVLPTVLSLSLTVLFLSPISFSSLQFSPIIRSFSILAERQNRKSFAWKCMRVKGRHSLSMFFPFQYYSMTSFFLLSLRTSSVPYLWLISIDHPCPPRGKGIRRDDRFVQWRSSVHSLVHNKTELTLTLPLQTVRSYQGEKWSTQLFHSNWHENEPSLVCGCIRYDIVPPSLSLLITSIVRYSTTRPPVVWTERGNRLSIHINSMSIWVSLYILTILFLFLW